MVSIWAQTMASIVRKSEGRRKGKSTDIFPQAPPSQPVRASNQKPHPTIVAFDLFVPFSGTRAGWFPIVPSSQVLHHIE